MLSVIIPTRESERALVPTLACLVPGATAGLIREVILADAGSRDETAEVGDVAGCRFLPFPGPLGTRLSFAASSARAPWLMFLRPGVVLDGEWVREAGRLIDQAPEGHAAVFRCASEPAAPSSLLGELARVFRGRFAKPKPEQGLLIGKPLYDRAGGHRDGHGDVECDLLARLGRKRIVTLRSAATIVDSVK